MTLVAGIDSSTQSVKVLVCDAATGEVVREGRAGHPDGTECPPSAWWDALTDATHGLLDDVAAVSVAGQQHGMVLLDDEGKVVRPALLWNDTRSARAADDLVRELGGGQAWADAVGSVPLASFTVTKLRWVVEHEPEVAERAARVLLPHDWLTWRLSGESGEPVTDRGDASGTGYWSPGAGAYRHDLVELAFGRQLDLPRLAAPSEVVGHTKSGIALAAGTGDNMGAALALGLRSGDLAVSLGTSGTVFAVAEEASADGSGLVAGFADATGRYLPLACTLNAARVLTSTATMLEVDLDRLSDLALDAPAGADGLVLLPYLDGERTPNLPDATGQLVGLTRASMTRSSVARAAVEGMLCGLADAYDAVLATGVDPQRVLLVGGAARSPAVQHIAAAVLGRPITIPEPGEYVALGAARQAAWAIGGDADPPSWPVHTLATVQAAPTPHVREAYADAREAAYGR